MKQNRKIKYARSQHNLISSILVIGLVVTSVIVSAHSFILLLATILVFAVLIIFWEVKGY